MQYSMYLHENHVHERSVSTERKQIHSPHWLSLLVVTIKGYFQRHMVTKKELVKKYERRRITWWFHYMSTFTIYTEKIRMERMLM